MFNLENVEDYGYTPLEKGVYPAHVDEVSFKESKAGNEYLSIQWRLENGRVLFDNLSLLHPDEKVKNIAMAKLKSMLKASGFEVNSFASKEELVGVVQNVRCTLKVDVKADQNTISNYLSESKVPNETPKDVIF